MKTTNLCAFHKIEVTPNYPVLGQVKQIVPGPHESAGVNIVPISILSHDGGEHSGTGFLRICKHCGCVYWEPSDETSEP